MRIVADLCENGWLVTVHEPVTPATVMRMVQEASGPNADLSGIIDNVQRLVGNADPTKRYVFGSLVNVGQFFIGLADDVDDGSPNGADDASGDDWGEDLDGNPLGDPTEDPLYELDPGGVVHPDSIMPSTEDFDDSFVGEHNTMPLVNGDEIILPAGTQFEVGGELYRTDEGDRAIFCGLLKANMETALIQVPLGEGIECVTRVDKHSFTPAKESDHGE